MALRNLLIIDPFVPQSYYILQALKSYYSRIVAVRHSGGLLPGVFSYTANSKFISRAYCLQYPKEDWENAVSCSGNSDSVERFINGILSICRREKIKLIYPCNDFTVFILSKNQNRFSESGIDIPVLSISSLRQIVDKYNIIELVKDKGILYPKTFLVSNLGEFETGIAKLGFPVILKRRFGSGSRGVRFIDKDNCEDIRRNLSVNFNRHYILQEFIPGKEIVYIRLYMDRQHHSVVESYVRNNRPELRIFQGRALSVETIEPPKIIDSIKDFFSSLQYVGYGHVQLKRDQRDQSLKFLELNPRISQEVWTEISLGFNAPYLNYCLFYKNDYLPIIYNRQAEIFFLDPIQDTVVLIKYLFYLFKKSIYRPIAFISNKKNSFRNLPKLSEIISDYRRRHLSSEFSQRRYNFFLLNLPKDPLVSFCYWLAFIYEIIKKEHPHEF